ncbi:MAG: DUF5615 family PIN-like protein [Nitrospira sp.]|nr:DUF5615 family PIN-like protein [Nitrospira sp.]
MDADFPPGLAGWLRERGHDAIRIHDHPGVALDDRAIFEFARRHQYVIITKDEDFAILATLDDKPAAVVWVRIGNATNPCCKTGWHRFFLRSCSVLPPEKLSSK